MAVLLRNEAEEIMQKEEGDKENKSNGVTITSIWYIFGSGDVLVVTRTLWQTS